MPFKLEVLRGATTYNISAGQPIFIVDADDLGGASVRNIEESGPYQDGSTHLDERLEPRTITLKLNVVGSTAAALDGHRDTLNAMFKPVRGVPITLKVTRDDGEIRQIDCRRTGPLNIPLRKEDYPGHLHRAVVQLRAADPTFYDPVEQEETFLPSSDWWLAFNTIGSANVLTHVDLPGTAQAWALSAPVAANSPWTIAVRTAPASSVVRVMYQAGSAYMANASGGTAFGAWTATDDTAGGDPTGSFAILSGTVNYMVVAAPGTAIMYRDNVGQGTITGATQQTYPLGTATPGRWRSNVPHLAGNVWDAAMPHAAVYNIALSSTQRSALDDAMRSIGTVYNSAVVYEGDVDSYPVITINGPLGNPIITNSATGDVLDFTGGTIGSGEYWVIDTRYGRKRAVNQAGSSIAHYLSNPSDLATFRLVPDPIATGGTNPITVAGTNISGSTTVELAFFTRFVGY